MHVEIRTLNVKGDAAFVCIMNDDNTIKDLILIDAGSSSTELTTLWEKYYKKHKVSMVIISHWDTDHYLGIENEEMWAEGCVLYSPRLGRKNYSPFVYEELDDMHSPKVVKEWGEHKEIKLICYGNENEYWPFEANSNMLPVGTPKNDSSLIFVLKAWGQRYYTGGDINKEVEEELVAGLPDNIPFDLWFPHYLQGMKVSHHGSDTSTPEIFLRKTYPNAAIITRFDTKHPTLNCAELLNKYAHITLSFVTNSELDKLPTYFMVMGDSITQIFSNNRYYITLRIDAKISAYFDYLYTPQFYHTNENATTWFFLRLHTVDLPKPKRNILKNCAADSISALMPEAEWVESENGKIYNADSCTLYPARNVKLKNCRCNVDEVGKITVEATWGNAMLKGNITNNEMHLSLATSDTKLSVKGLILLLTDTFQEIEYLPEDVFPELTVDSIALNVSDRKALCVQALVSTTVGKDIQISDGIVLKAPVVSGAFGFTGGEGGSYIKSLYTGIETRIAIKDFEVDIYIDIVTGNRYQLSARTEKLALQNLLELIPGMKEQKIQSWCEWLHMDTVELTGATCEIAWENGFKLNFVECCFTITPVATYEFAVTCDYFPLSGQCRLNGKTTQAIELKTLLEAFGVQRSHLSFLPDLTVDDCEFTANPSQHAYNVHTDIRLETAAETTIGVLTLSLSTVQVEIEKNNENTAIGIGLTGSLNKRDISLRASYDPQNGFCFDGEIEAISISDAVKAIMPGDNGLMKKFDLTLEDASFKFSRQENLFAASVPSIPLGKGIQLNNNSVDLRVVNHEVSFCIQTTLEIHTGGEFISVSSGLNISPKSIYLFAFADMAYRNVLGIKGLDIGKMAVCLAENLTPPGMSIGLTGELALELRRRTLTGDIALYLSPQIPDKQLVAINFNGLSLLDVVEVFVQCPDGSVKETLESMGLFPLTLTDQLALTNPDSCEEAILLIDNYEGENGRFEIQTHEKYSWIPENTKVLKNKTNFKTYELIPTDNGHWKVKKYVGMYACVNPKGEGIEMNGVTFKPGFAFCAQLAFLGMTAIVDFTAAPQRGIRLYAEMQKAVRIGNVLEICRVEDSTKGPVVALSTYPEDLYFYLSAKCRIAGIFEEKARIAFGNNRFALYLYRDILGFKTTIEASGELKLWEGNGWMFSLLFESNGFSEITQRISNALHEIADNINKATTEATKKLDAARRTVKEHERDVQNIQNEIDRLNVQLNQLKHTKYPWYQAYKYIALGARIAAIGISIGALATSKLVALGVLKAAQGILKLAEEAVKAAGTLTADALRLLGDVTSIVGKSIDWLIKIERVYAELDTSKKELDFQFSIAYQLCGKKHNNGFSLSYQGNLGETLYNLIMNKNDMAELPSQPTMEENPADKLDMFYGTMDAEEIRALDNIDWEIVENNLQKAADEGQQYTSFMNALGEDLAMLDRSNAEGPVMIFDLESLKSIQCSFDQSQTYIRKTGMLCTTLNEEDLETLKKAAEVLQKEAGSNIDMPINMDLKYDKYGTMNTACESCLREMNDKLSNHLTNNGFVEIENNGIPSESASILVSRLRTQAEEGSDVLKSLLYPCIAEAYTETDDTENASKYAISAIEKAVSVYGESAEETKMIRERMNSIINK